MTIIRTIIAGCCVILAVPLAVFAAYTVFLWAPFAVGWIVQDSLKHSKPS